MKLETNSIETAKLQYQQTRARYFEALSNALSEFEALGATARVLHFIDSQQHLKHVDEPAALLRIEIATALNSQSGDE